MSLDELLFVEKQAKFERLCKEAMLDRHRSGEAGIGTLAEKRLHAVIKRFLCEDEDFHEVGVPNTRYVSDVRIGNDIYEVQTGAFYPMQKKILYYMENTDCTVTVVHPIAVKKWVSWLDPKTGDISERRRSSRQGKPEDVLAELYSLLPVLGNPRLRFRLLLIEAQDFRLLSGRTRNRKLGSKKYERIPLSLIDDLKLNRPCDFRFMIPDMLPDHFTVKDFSKATKIRGRDAYSAVRVLCALGLFAPADPIGRSMGWKKV